MDLASHSPDVMFYFPNKPVRVYDPEKIVGVLNPLSSWIVQPKWDGKRVEIDCNAKGVVTLYGRQNQVFKETWPWLADLDLPRPWFVDGELLRDGRIFVWDFAVLDGKPVFREPYGSRLARLQAALPGVKTQNNQTIACIETLPASAYKTLLGRAGAGGMEGIVLKHLAATNLWGPYSTSEVATQFKYRFK